MRPLRGSGNLEGFVLNANTGEQSKGKVSSWKRENNRKIDLEPVSTDANGLEINEMRPVLGFWSLMGGKNCVESFYVYQNNNQYRPNERSVFFTGRSLYHDQTIRYKGVSYHIDQEKDNYKVIPIVTSRWFFVIQIIRRLPGPSTDK